MKTAVIGAGQIGTPVVQRLAQQGRAVTWISRTRPKTIPAGVEFVQADVTDGDALAAALAAVDAVVVAVNPTTYDVKVWQDTLPPMHRGLIAAAKKTGVRVVLLEGLYEYALDQGPLSPSTPMHPVTEKGRIRKGLTEMWDNAGVRLVRVRASDFWGPGLNAALVTRHNVSKTVFLIGNPDVPHAFTHIDDLTAALITLTTADGVEGQTFHAPVTHMTPRALAGLNHSKTFDSPRWLLRLIGLFDKSTGGLVEMLPQWDQPYLVDDSAYRTRFGVTAKAT